MEVSRKHLGLGVSGLAVVAFGIILAAAALARYEQAVLVAVEDVETALVGFAEEKNVLDRRARARTDAERSAELARSLYRLGLTDFLTVLDAERRLSDVDDRVAVTETNVRTRLVRLYKSLGGGWEVVDTIVETPPAHRHRGGQGT